MPASTLQSSWASNRTTADVHHVDVRPARLRAGCAGRPSVCSRPGGDPDAVGEALCTPPSICSTSTRRALIHPGRSPSRGRVGARSAAAAGAARAARGDGRCCPAAGDVGRRADADRALLAVPVDRRRRAGSVVLVGVIAARRRSATASASWLPCSRSRPPPLAGDRAQKAPQTGGMLDGAGGADRTRTHRASISSSCCSRCRRRWSASAPSTRSARRSSTSCAR